VAQIVRSAIFDRWLKRLKDASARARILVRITRLAQGDPGDVEPVGQGISELRINYGPGYRVYFKQRGDRLAILLCGGDKSSHAADIALAKSIADQWSET
jgi:putative addiction module killer protein